MRPSAENGGMLEKAFGNDDDVVLEQANALFALAALQQIVHVDVENLLPLARVADDPGAPRGRFVGEAAGDRDRFENVDIFLERVGAGLAHLSEHEKAPR